MISQEDKQLCLQQQDFAIISFDQNLFFCCCCLLLFFFWLKSKLHHLLSVVLKNNANELHGFFFLLVHTKKITKMLGGVPIINMGVY